MSRFGVHKFIIMYIETGSIGQRPGSGHISEVTGCVKTLVKEQMQRDDETTAHQTWYQHFFQNHPMLPNSGHFVAVPTAN